MTNISIAKLCCLQKNNAINNFKKILKNNFSKSKFEVHIGLEVLNLSLFITKKFFENSTYPKRGLHYLHIETAEMVVPFILRI